MNTEDRRQRNNAAAKRWRVRHPEKAKAVKKAWVLTHPEKAKAGAARRNKRYFERHPEALERINKRSQKFRIENPAVASARTKRSNQKLKKVVLTRYGGGSACCVRCGYVDMRALSIDHINGGGNKHRKADSGVKAHMYQWLKQHNFPTGYQTLCMNCQWIKRDEQRELAWSRRG